MINRIHNLGPDLITLSDVFDEYLLKLLMNFSARYLSDDSNSSLFLKYFKYIYVHVFLGLSMCYGTPGQFLGIYTSKI